MGHRGFGPLLYSAVQLVWDSELGEFSLIILCRRTLAII